MNTLPFNPVPKVKAQSKRLTPEDTVLQLEGVVNDFMMRFPEHTAAVPTVRPGQDPLVACVTSVVSSMQRKTEQLERATREAREAREATKVQSAFLANMSHEVRTPMNGIFGLVEALLDTDLNHDQEDYLRSVKRCSEHLLNVLNDVLDISKMSANQLALRPRVFELDKVIRDIFWIYSSLAEDKGLSFTYLIDEEIESRLLGDDLRLKQILSNLISNAVKFTESGSVTLYVQCPYADTHPEYLFFSVCDTGKGIKEDSIADIFEPFTQANTSMTREYEGTGLGLAICRNLVSMMDGEIWVESIPEKGSSFSFTAYFQNENEASDAQRLVVDDKTTSVSVVSDQFEDQSIEPLKVLLVEDNEVNRKVATLCLQKLNYEVDIAHNGAVAVEKAGGEVRYDLIVMDLSMPVMDGLEATRRIRALDHENSQAGIIAMTGMAFEDDRDRCMEANMNDFIAKPFSIQELERKISKVCPVVAMAS